MTDDKTSNRFAVDASDMKKLGTGMLIAAVGAVLAYGTEWVSDTDLGMWAPTVAAVWAVVANFARKFMAGQGAGA